MSEWVDQIIQGDCLTVLRQMPDGCVDAIVTDPPYFKVKGEAWDRQWDTPTHFLAWMAELRDEWHRLLKPNGSLYVFASPQMAADVQVCMKQRFSVLNHIIWRKAGNGRHSSAHKEGLRAYFPNTERIIFAEHYGADTSALGMSGYGAKCDELRGFIFEPLRAYLDGERRQAGLNFEEVRAIVKCANGSGLPSHWFTSSQWMLPTARHYAMLREASGFFQREYEALRREYEALRRPFAVTEDVPYTDVWDFSTVRPYPGKHVCEKPLPLCQHIIRTSTRPGALVLDCFAGSGAILDAAQREGRHYLGIEISEHWVNEAQRRLNAPTMIPALVPISPRVPHPVYEMPSLWEAAS